MGNKQPGIATSPSTTTKHGPNGAIKEPTNRTLENGSAGESKSHRVRRTYKVTQSAPSKGEPTQESVPALPSHRKEVETSYQPAVIPSSPPLPEPLSVKHSATLPSCWYRRPFTVDLPPIYPLHRESIPSVLITSKLESSTTSYYNDDHLYPDAVTPTKVERRLERIGYYDIAFMDDEAFINNNWYRVSSRMEIFLNNAVLADTDEVTSSIAEEVASAEEKSPPLLIEKPTEKLTPVEENIRPRSPRRSRHICSCISNV